MEGQQYGPLREGLYLRRPLQSPLQVEVQVHYEKTPFRKEVKGVAEYLFERFCTVKRTE